MVHRDTLPDVIRRASAGDETALGELFQLYGKMVFETAYRLTMSADEADDVAQDVFVGLPEALRRYTEQSQFDAWLKRITVRITLARMRRERRRANIITVEAVTANESNLNDNVADALNVSMTIGHALQQLAEPARLVFTLKAAEGYSHAEIAQLLGISRAASEVRYWRAVRRLRSILESEK